MNRDDRCYYELIGEDKACTLYFDLEFERECNPQLRGKDEEIMAVFKSYVIEFVAIELDLKLRDDALIDLTSSTASKFSRHVIVDMDPYDAVFRHNRDCGVFVDRMCGAIRSAIQSGRCPNAPKLEMLMVNRPRVSRLSTLSRGIDRILLVDQSVYSRNRCFRLIRSSKWKYLRNGNTPSFLTYSANQHRDLLALKFTKRTADSDRRKFREFLDTLVCAVVVDDSTRIIQYSEHSVPRSISLQLTPSKTVRNRREQNLSPFPGLDRFITDLVRRWGRTQCPWTDGMDRMPRDITASSPLFDAPRNGTVRCCKSFVDSNDSVAVLTYTVEGNRFCMNIARCHKSNGIYFMVQRGDGTVRQKCFDPECHDFVSPPIEIPEYIDELDGDGDDAEFEKLLVLNCLSVEAEGNGQSVAVPVGQGVDGKKEDIAYLVEDEGDYEMEEMRSCDPLTVGNGD